MPEGIATGDPGVASSVAADVSLEDPSINVCFSTTNALFSRFIRFATRASVSHALVTFRSQTLGRVMVMEATGRGFNVVPWRKWKQKNQLVARFEIAAPQSAQVRALQRLADELGAEYDTLSLFGFATRRWQKRARNPLDDPTKLICSEVVAKLLKEVGLPAFDDPGGWTPADLFSHALDHPDRFQKAEEGQAMEVAEKRADGDPPQA